MHLRLVALHQSVLIGNKPRSMVEVSEKLKLHTIYQSAKFHYRSLYKILPCLYRLHAVEQL